MDLIGIEPMTSSMPSAGKPAQRSSGRRLSDSAGDSASFSPSRCNRGARLSRAATGPRAHA